MKRRGRRCGRSTLVLFSVVYADPDAQRPENVELPALLRGASDSQSRGDARALLEQLGLGKRLHHLPAQLSGGEQQRVALARAFNGRPAILFADEPTGNLDRQTGDKIADLLFSLNREHGTTLILVTHDPLLAARCDRRLRWMASCGRKHDRPLVLARMALAVAADRLAGVKPRRGLRAGLGSISDRMEKGLSQQSREFMAGDRTLRSSREVPAEWIAQARKSGLTVGEQLSFATMTFAGDTPQLADVKAVDDRYPLYGTLETQPPGLKPQAGSVLLAPRLMALLNLKTGDTIDVGDATLRIAGEVIQEPDAGFNPSRWRRD